MFDKVDTSDDRKISLKEFRQSIGSLKKWGVKCDSWENEFKRIDINGGGSLLFDEFAEWAIKCSDDFKTNVKCRSPSPSPVKKNPSKLTSPRREDDDEMVVVPQSLLDLHPELGSTLVTKKHLRSVVDAKTTTKAGDLKTNIVSLDVTPGDLKDPTVMNDFHSKATNQGFARNAMGGFYTS